MEFDASGWSGDGAFTERLIEAIGTIPEVVFLKVDDAPASRADAGFSFISNELFVAFATRAHVSRGWAWGVIPHRVVTREHCLTLSGLEASLAALEDIGLPDYSDEGMLQYLRSERIVQPYQTRAYKLVELVRIYEAGTAPRRD